MFTDHIGPPAETLTLFCAWLRKWLIGRHNLFPLTLPICHNWTLTTPIKDPISYLLHYTTNTPAYSCSQLLQQLVSWSLTLLFSALKVQLSCSAIAVSWQHLYSPQALVSFPGRINWDSAQLLGPAVRRLDNFIKRINPYPVDKICSLSNQN